MRAYCRYLVTLAMGRAKTKATATCRRAANPSRRHSKGVRTRSKDRGRRGASARQKKCIKQDVRHPGRATVQAGKIHKDRLAPQKKSLSRISGMLSR